MIAPNGTHTRNGWTESIQCELYCQQSKYEEAGNFQTRSIALEKCLFLALYMKNFVLAHKYVALLSVENEEYIHLWEENDMPYLQEVFQNSVVFENAFAYVANTHPVLRAMFLGKKDIDDGVYNVKEINRDII